MWQRNPYAFAWSAVRNVPFLGRSVDVIVEAEPDAGGPTPRQLELLRRAECLPADFLGALVEPLLDYAVRTKEYYAGDPHALVIEVNPASVLTQIEVSTLTIPPLGTSERNAFVLSGERAWEREHGLEVLVDLDTGQSTCDHVGSFCHSWDSLNGANDWDSWSDKARRWARTKGRW